MSLTAPDARRVYEDLYCVRGQSENWIKRLKPDLASDRTSCTTFPANAMHLLQHAAAYVLHQQLRTQALRHTALAHAQPSTAIAKLFKIAVQVRQFKDRVMLHLPSSCPARQLLYTVTERLFVPRPASLLHAPPDPDTFGPSGRDLPHHQIADPPVPWVGQTSPARRLPTNLGIASRQFLRSGQFMKHSG